jgi:hypothetical protein
MMVSSNIKNTAFLVSQHTVTYQHLDPRILLCTLFSNTHNQQCSVLSAKELEADCKYTEYNITPTCVTGTRPVPSDTTAVRGHISDDLPDAFRARLYSWISVIASRVGLFAIRPPSRKRPKALYHTHRHTYATHYWSQYMS